MIWKLLKQHISWSQILGFSLANLFGMIVVLLCVQIYQDITPVMNQEDGFMKKDYMIISKKVSTLGSLVGHDGGFSESEIQNLRSQSFSKAVGEFVAAQYKVSAGIGFKGMNMYTAMFFEAVPDEFVDVDMKKWNFEPEEDDIPIIVPRNYLNLYNFGFAKSRNLPQLSEGLIGMISIDVHLHGNGKRKVMRGRIVGFSNRLNTILVPYSFMQWANAELGEGARVKSSRVILQVDSPANDEIAKYFSKKGYEVENDKLDAGKTAWFLKLIIGVVLMVGLIISLLAFYILLLSIYLLIQKNTTKIENLLLIGYSPDEVAMPYQLLTIVLNASVLILGMGIVCVARSYYMEYMEALAGTAIGGGVYTTIIVGICLVVFMSAINCVIIRHKVTSCFIYK